MKIKQVFFSLLFCLIFIGCFMSNNVYAENIVGYVSDKELSENQYDSLYRNASNYIVSDSFKSVSDIGNKIRLYHCQKMIECVESGFTNTDFIIDVDVTAEYTYASKDKFGIWNLHSSKYTTAYDAPITEINTKFLDLNCNDMGRPSTVVFTVGEDTYTLKIYTSKYLVGTESSGYTSVSKSVTYDAGYNSSQNGKRILEYFRDCAIEGILAGAVGVGYNVGTPYSDIQRPLNDVMEIVGNGYDFKQLSGLDFALDYYFSPLFGKLYSHKEPYIPATTDEWIEYGVSNLDTFIEGNSVKINEEFMAFTPTLSDTSINAEGLKISNISIENGAKRMSIDGSENPKSVLSYNIQMAVPFVFYVTNNNAQLSTNRLRVLDRYTYNLFNDSIYDNDMVVAEGETNKVTTMYDVMGGNGRNHIYLYNQVTETGSEEEGTLRKVKYGIILVGLFDECVVDTSGAMDSSNSENIVVGKPTANLMLTGRKIGLDGSYSDSLSIQTLNSNLMFVQGLNGGVKEGFLPLNVSFPATTDELEVDNIYSSLTGELSLVAPEFTQEIKDMVLPWDDTTLYKHINNKKMHGEVPKNVRVLHFLIDFDEVFLKQKKMNSEGNIIGISDDAVSAGIYRFFIIRNNNYIYDESLIEWLKTDNARSISYVDAEGLIAKITGDFSSDIKEITYSEWLSMQEIKHELEMDKDRWLISVMNIMSTVMGTILIIFAILFMLAYWIDIFNVFIDFSILKFVSFGNLCSVSSYDMADYLGRDSGCKYVTFKDVFIIACIMIAFGLLFLNVKSIMYFIVYMYNYFLRTLGGVFSW